MKIILVFIRNLILLLSILLMTLQSTGCQEKSDANSIAQESSAKPVISDDGTTIRFPVETTGLRQIQTTEAREGTALVSVIAPARVVATILPAVTLSRNIILFESPDITTLYSQYRQSSSNVELTSKNLVHVKEMYNNQGATARDLNQAETDAANARASMGEMEGKLRAFGFNPAELESVKMQTAWLMSDVPETELHKVEKGENVVIVFSSFPDKKFIGKAAAIGDIVDPVTRTVKVRVTLQNPNGRLLPGMFARVDFSYPQHDVILLPLNAIVTVDANDYAFVQTAEREFSRRKVTISNANELNAVVLDGISVGEKVVTSGTMLLKGLSFGY
ncbi:MAG: efflux RND transporter periplasmic adaptor subunit [Bacteroidota bacterium]